MREERDIYSGEKERCVNEESKQQSESVVENDGVCSFILMPPPSHTMPYYAICSPFCASNGFIPQRGMENHEKH